MDNIIIYHDRMVRKLAVLILLVVSVAILFSGCLEGEEGKVTYKKFTDGKFSVEYPDWTRLTGLETELAPLRLQEGNCFMNVLKFSLMGKFFREFAEGEFSSAVRYLEEPVILTKRIGNTEAILEIEYLSSGLKAREKKRALLCNDLVYFIGIGCLEEEYLKNEEIINYSISSGTCK